MLNIWSVMDLRRYGQSIPNGQQKGGCRPPGRSGFRVAGCQQLETRYGNCSGKKDKAVVLTRALSVDAGAGSMRQGIHDPR